MRRVGEAGKKGGTFIRAGAFNRTFTVGDMASSTNPTAALGFYLSVSEYVFQQRFVPHDIPEIYVEHHLRPPKLC